MFKHFKNYYYKLLFISKKDNNAKNLTKHVLSFININILLEEDSWFVIKKFIDVKLNKFVVNLIMYNLLYVYN